MPDVVGPRRGVIRDSAALYYSRARLDRGCNVARQGARPVGLSMQLSRKLALALVGVMIVVLAANAYLRILRDMATFQSDTERDHRAMAEVLRPAFRQVWLSDGEEAAFVLLRRSSEQLSRLNTPLNWVWLDGADPLHRATMPAPALAVIEPGQVVSIIDAQRDVLVTYAEVSVGPRRGAVEIIESLAEGRKRGRATILRTVITTSAVAVFSGLVSWWLGIVMVGRPIERMVDKARRTGRGDFGGPIPDDRADELGELARAMNTMAEQLAMETEARQQAREQLRHAERLNTVGKLAAGVAHELGTPIHVVAARARMIATGRVLGDAASDSARIIGDQCDRMTHIIRQLLDFARMSGGERRPVDLVELAKGAVAMLEPVAEKASVGLSVSAELPHATVLADRTQLMQVVTNLILNAVHAQPSGGSARVVVATGAPRSGLSRAEHGFVSITVEDRGAGVPPDVLPHIFEPFFTTKDVGEGTGLGLSVAYGIVEEHGGWIQVATAVGEGSRFAVHLPSTPHP
jgi:two-component system NtrC family sensor kinase